MGRPPHGHSGLHSQKLSDKTKTSLSKTSISDQGAEVLKKRMDRGIKNRIFDLKANMEVERKKSVIIYEVMKELECKKEEHSKILNQLKEDRQHIQDQLNLHGLKVDTIGDFKLMTELWKLGFDHLYVYTSRTFCANIFNQMRRKYGITWDITYWDVKYVELTDLKLEEELGYFESQYLAQVRHDDRRRLITNVINALKAEIKRREIEQAKQEGTVPVKHMFDSWQVAKFHD